MDGLRDDIVDALTVLCGATGLDVRALFDRRAIDRWDALSPRAAYCAGFIEGAAQSNDMTVIELLDALDIDVPDGP